MELLQCIICPRRADVEGVVEAAVGTGVQEAGEPNTKKEVMIKRHFFCIKRSTPWKRGIPGIGQPIGSVIIGQHSVSAVSMLQGGRELVMESAVNEPLLLETN